MNSLPSGPGQVPQHSGLIFFSSYTGTTQAVGGLLGARLVVGQWLAQFSRAQGRSAGCGRQGRQGMLKKHLVRLGEEAFEFE